MTGASAGIGFELATGLADRGHDIVGVGASDRIDTLPERLPTVSVTPVRVDLSTAAGVKEPRERFESLGRPLDVAALNAGKSLGGAFLDNDLDDELHMLALNVTGQVMLAKNDPVLVATKGIDALLAGKDHVVGGNAKTVRGALRDKFLPDRVKAARFARPSRPDQ